MFLTVRPLILADIDSDSGVRVWDGGGDGDLGDCWVDRVLTIGFPIRDGVSYLKVTGLGTV